MRLSLTGRLALTGSALLLALLVKERIGHT
jgi:hypothetical protein